MSKENCGIFYNNTDVSDALIATITDPNVVTFGQRAENTCTDIDSLDWDLILDGDIKISSTRDKISIRHVNSQCQTSTNFFFGFLSRLLKIFRKN